MIELLVNGSKCRFEGDPDTPLLWVLRDDLGLTGTRFGCGAGLCGCCTVLVGRDAVRSCVTPLAGLAGASVTTIEGLGAQRLHPLQTAWIAHAVPQRRRCWRRTPRPPSRRSTRRWRATCAAAAPIRAYASRSARPRRQWRLR